MKKFFDSIKPWLTRLLIVPPIIVGVVVLAYAVRNRLEPERMPEVESARVLRVISVPKLEYVPRIIGYGTSRPASVWQAIAEVKGRVIKLHPDLTPGSFIKADELLVRLDDTDIQLMIDRLASEIAKVNASMAELQAQEKNYEASVSLERDVLEVAEQELQRLEELLDDNAASQADVDTQKRAVFAQRQSVQSVVSNLNLLPSKIQAAKASIAVSEANLAESKRDLARLQIKAPFACRIGPVDLELDQFVNAGESLFEAQAISAFEIEAQVSVMNLRKLVNEKLRKQELEAGTTEISQDLLRRFFDVVVVVRYDAGGERVQRSAKFDRLREQLDSQTRMGGVVVSIEQPYQDASNGPPPVSGTFCEVELQGKPRADQIIIPRSSIRDNHVYILDKENRLLRREVKVLTTQSAFAVIEDGLEGNETLVISDPTPAVEGMLVKPETDNEMLEMLREQASGEGDLR